MSKNKNTLQPTSQHADADGYRKYRIVPTGIGSSSEGNSVASEYGGDSMNVFDDDDQAGTSNVRQIVVKKREYKYVQWGVNDQLPYSVRKKLMENMVTAQCQQFNIVSCYGQGVRFVDRETRKDVSDKEIRDFCLYNSLQEVFLEQVTDFKFFFFSVTVIILSSVY